MKGPARHDASTAEHVLDDRLTVDRKVHGLADLAVVEGRLLDVEEVDDQPPALHRHDTGVAAVEQLELRHGGRGDDVDASAPELGGARRRVLDDAEDEALRDSRRRASRRGWRPARAAGRASTRRTCRGRSRSGCWLNAWAPIFSRASFGRMYRRTTLKSTVASGSVVMTSTVYGIPHLDARDALGEDRAPVLRDRGTSRTSTSRPGRRRSRRRGTSRSSRRWKRHVVGFTISQRSARSGTGLSSSPSRPTSESNMWTW